MINQITFLIGIWFIQGHSLEKAKISFEIAHMGVLTVKGHFDDINGHFTQISDSVWLITGKIDVTSIDTGNADRDKTILTKQYLDAVKHPLIPFEARLVQKRGEFFVIVDIELRGISFQLTGELYQEEGVLVSFPITFERSEIGLDFGLMDSLIGDVITLKIDSGIEVDELDN